MIQDIYPSSLDNSYKSFEMRDEDTLLCDNYWYLHFVLNLV